MSETRTPLHDQPKLCAHILGSVERSSVPLKIATSSIPKAGSGLFVVTDVVAGSEIFRSQPLVMVCEGNNNGICDYCFRNRNSSVHPDGQFYVTGGPDKVTLAACIRCKNVQYCSKKCQALAWKSYHKHECAIIQEVGENNKNMGAVPQALARLLLWIKKQVLSEDDFNTIVSMEHHYDERCDRWLEVLEENEDAVLEPTLQTAYQVKQTTDCKLGLGQVQKLFLILLQNGGAICPPEMVDQYGTFLDLVVSTINHSCDSNAHIYFNGRELRCRALKDIPAGTEITVHYHPEPRHDVLLRRNILDEFMYFECNCKRCRKEIAEHLAEVPDRKDHLHKVKDAQMKLEKLGIDAQKAFLGNRTLNLCILFQDQVNAVVLKGYPRGRWPEHIEPLPHIYSTLGGMYLDLQFAVGLEFILKGTLYVTDKADPNWMADLWNLIRFMFFMAQADENDINWLGTENKSPSKRVDMRNVARGYMVILCLRAKFTFGMDTGFVQALYRWAGDTLDIHSPKVETKSFREGFEQSQKTLLKWANISFGHGLPLPTSEEVAKMKEDIQALGAIKLGSKAGGAVS
ncbi:unnamed protein product [Discula destructiva]